MPLLLRWAQTPFTCEWNKNKYQAFELFIGQKFSHGFKGGSLRPARPLVSAGPPPGGCRGITGPGHSALAPGEVRSPRGPWPLPELHEKQRVHTVSGEGGHFQPAEWRHGHLSICCPRCPHPASKPLHGAFLKRKLQLPLCLPRVALGTCTLPAVLVGSPLSSLHT